MKRCVICLVLALFLSGCSGVIMNAEYSQLLDKTAALSAQTATRASAGTLSSGEMSTALVAQSQTWVKFQNARDGVK